MSSPTSIGLSNILAAQAQSAADAAENARVAALNAPGFAQLEAKGITVKTISFSQIYKDHILKSVDTNGDGIVSEAEMDQQVEAGGGTQAQAAALYKAMDMNGDGSVSAQEFEDSIPFSTADFLKQRDAMMAMLQNGQTPASTSQNPLDFLFGMSPESLDASRVLSNLAGGFPTNA